MRIAWASTEQTLGVLGNLANLCLPFVRQMAVCPCISCTQERMAILLALSLPHQEPTVRVLKQFPEPVFVMVARDD